MHKILQKFLSRFSDKDEGTGRGPGSAVPDHPQRDPETEAGVELAVPRAYATRRRHGPPGSGRDQTNLGPTAGLRDRSVLGGSRTHKIESVP